MENPYKAPTTPMKDAPPAPRSPILAVIAGLAVDIGGTLVVGLVISVVYAGMLVREGMSPEQLEEALTQPDADSGYIVAVAAAGAAFSFLGGYVCARIVRRRERRYAVILGALSGAITLALSGAPGSWGNLGFALLTFVAVMLGSELGRYRNLAGGGSAGPASAA